jgi:hypothetical protein
VQPLLAAGYTTDIEVGVMPKARLLDVVRDRIRVKHYSYRKETSYLAWIRRLICFDAVRHSWDMGRVVTPCS